MNKRIRRFTDAKLVKELAFARGFAPATTEAEQQWLDALEAEARRRATAIALSDTAPRRVHHLL
jgi:hypothetical protein